MAHHSNGMDRARKNGVANAPGAGTAAAIRKALAIAGEPCTKGRISYITGINVETVERALQQLVGRTGGVVAIEGSKPRKYDLSAAAGKTERRLRRGGSGQLAGPITIPGYVYGGTRLG